MTTRVLLSWSGGKDAAWSLEVLRRAPDVEVVALLTTITAGDERASMQGIHVDVLRAQSRAVDLPLIEVRIAPHARNLAYEQALAVGLQDAASRWPGLSHVAFGDLFLADIRAYRVALCARLGWTPLFPLFDAGADTGALADAMIAAGLRARVCCVDTTQLPDSFAGRAFDASLRAALPVGVDPCGENGEFHTCAWDGPMFARALPLDVGDTSLRDGRFAHTDLLLREE